MPKKPKAAATEASPPTLSQYPSSPGKKTPCPITRQRFREKAVGLVCTVDGQSVIAGVKEFSTDSLGYYANGNIVVTIDGVPCKATINFSIVLANSKELPK